MNNLKKVLFILIFLMKGVFSFSQVGGDNTYEFLNLTNSARVASLGGNQISIKDNDLNFVFHNPALLNAEMDKNIVLNYVNYFADINYYYVAYAQKFDSIGNFAFGIHHINYGDFQGTDETGRKTKDFSSSEYAFNLFYSREILDSLFTVGMNLKPIYSVLENYVSYGISSDFGITYDNVKKLFTASVVLKNIGTQIKPYYSSHYEDLPFDIQIGITKKLEKAPFRFSFLFHHLNKLDMTYKNPNEKNKDNFFEEKTEKDEEIWWEDSGDKILRHFILGIEFLPSDNFFISAGYNYQRREELKLETKSGMTGISFGFGVRISRFQFSYARAIYHVAGASNHFSFSVNFNKKRL